MVHEDHENKHDQRGDEDRLYVGRHSEYTRRGKAGRPRFRGKKEQVYSTMAARQQQVDIHELQREMMADDVRQERALTSQALAGKTGRSGRGGAIVGRQPTQGRRENFNGSPRRAAERIDVHELLKQEAFSASESSCDDHFEKNRPCPSAVYGVSDQYMVLDSFEKVETSTPEKGEFKFNFMVQGVTRDQNIGVKDKLDTIIGIQVCSFCIPLLPFDDFDPATIIALNPALSALGLTANGPLPATGDAATNAQSQTPFCSRVTMYLKEIGLQSYSDADNRRHHFEFQAEPEGAPTTTSPSGDRLRLTPLEKCEYFLFTDPIQDVHGLTVCFYNPGNTLRFPPDCLYGVRVVSASPGQELIFIYNDPTNLLNLEVGDRIYIRGFSTKHPLLDTYVGRPEGHLVGQGGFNRTPPSPNGITVRFLLNPSISTAGLSPPIPPGTTIASSTQVVVCIAKNRVRIPLRFRRVVGRLTNYIAP